MLQRLMDAIAAMEGFAKPDSLASINNNPGNLRASSLATGKDPRGFAIFSTISDGWNALAHQLQLYADRGLTLREMLHIYAPAADGNDPEAYTNFVAGRLGVSADTPVSEVVATDPTPGLGTKVAYKSPAPLGLFRPLALACWLLLLGFSPAIEAQVSPDRVVFQAPAPSPAAGLSTTVSGPRAGVVYYYWVVANYAGGSASPSLVIEPNGPASLSGSNFVTVSWTPAAGATSYDLLRTAANTFPPGPCVCAVATGVAGPTRNDTGAALTSYTFAPKPAANGVIRLDNSGALPAFVTDPALAGGAGNIVLTSGAGDPPAGACTPGVTWWRDTSTTPNRILACSDASGIYRQMPWVDLSGLKTQGTIYHELAANGSNYFAIFGRNAMAANAAICLDGETLTGQAYVDTGLTDTAQLDGGGTVTCRILRPATLSSVWTAPSALSLVFNPVATQTWYWHPDTPTAVGCVGGGNYVDNYISIPAPFTGTITGVLVHAAVGAPAGSGELTTFTLLKGCTTTGITATQAWNTGVPVPAYGSGSVAVTRGELFQVSMLFPTWSGAAPTSIWLSFVVEGTTP